MGEGRSQMAGNLNRLALLCPIYENVNEVALSGCVGFSCSKEGAVIGDA